MSDCELQPVTARIAVASLEYPLLDYWVARAEGLETPEIDEYGCAYVHHHEPGDDGWWTQYKPTTDWATGGPIIEKARIELTDEGICLGHSPWSAYCEGQGDYRMAGDTPLIAAMRSYVAAKFGAYVEDAP